MKQLNDKPEKLINATRYWVYIINDNGKVCYDRGFPIQEFADERVAELSEKGLEAFYLNHLLNNAY